MCIRDSTLPLKSLDIYISGCIGNPHCEGCHNPESWDFNQGEEYTLDYFKSNIDKKVKEFDNLIDNIMIFGGEPLDSDIFEVEVFLQDLKELSKNIWLFTHYDLDEIPIFIQEKCDYIKTGRYLPKLKKDNYIQYGITLATSNQKIHKKGVDY